METTEAPDLGAQRGLSKETLALFNVRNNGTGWEWDTKCMDGSIGTRWKSYLSKRPAGDERWAKYRWIPGKPPAAKYFVAPKVSLRQSINDAYGALYLVGGEIAAMSMVEAGYMNATCTFGDSAIPDSLRTDLEGWEVGMLYLIPDRDKAGERWAQTIRKALVGAMDIDVIVLALPYPVEEKHGKDVNDYWLEIRDKDAFRARLKQLPEWRLPDIPPEPVRMNFQGSDNDEIPELLKSEIRRLLGVTEQYNNEGWSRKNVRCPFHDDKTPSATWNDEKAILHCHATCGRDYLVKDLCAHFSIRMGDYYSTAPSIEIKRNLPAVKLDALPPPLVQKHSPPLSEFARLSDAQREEAQRGRAWLDEYVSWAKEAAPLSPDIFYESMGLWTLALAATRRMKVVIGGENIYPNLYVFIVAATTVYRKSTALNLATRLIEQSNLDFLLMPERATPEALFEYLAGHNPPNHERLSEKDALYWSMGRTFAAQRAILEDEASGLLSEMKKDYMGGLSELLLKGYDGQGTLRKLLKSQGLITVRDMCLSFLGATTPIEWARRMGQEERQNGFVARFAIITPERAPIYEDSQPDISPPDNIIKQLRRMFLKVLPWNDALIGKDGLPHALPFGAEITTPPIQTVSIAPEAFEQISEYRRAMSYTMLKASEQGGEVEDEKAGSYARLGTMMIKVAMLLAAIDAHEGATVRIEPRHAYAAQLICERWRESLHRLDAHVTESRYNNLDEKVLKFIKNSGEIGVTARDIQRGCNLEPGKVTELTKTLLDAGVVELFKREGKGRPALCYKYTGQ